MTEYWVSQAKYYCKFCKQWMADNKTTRQLHDMSDKHKSQVEYYHKKKRDEKVKGARNEKELLQQMDMINKAAQEAVRGDMHTGGFYSKNPSQYSHGPPSFYNSQQQQQQQQQREILMSSSAPVTETTDKAISENLREDNSGIYTVGEVTYMEGQYHESLLVADTLCELFVEEEDNWCKAKVIKSRVTAIAHTDLEIRTYDVSYVPASSHEWEEEKAIVEQEVKSDRLRLIYTPPVVEEKKIDESTGFGMWETVSVRVIDEVEEAKAAAEKEKMEKEKKEKAREQQDLFESSAVEDSALASYDVYNTGTYKGIAITKSEASSRKIAEEMESVANGKEVDFKKRKTNGNKFNSKNKKRNIRKKNDED